MAITIAILRQAGLSPELIARVCELEQEETRARNNETAKLRMRSYRERNRVTDVTRNVTHVTRNARNASNDSNDLQFNLALGTNLAQDSTLTSLPESVSLKKDSSSKSDFPIDFREKFWALYPRRVGKKAAIRRLEMVRKSGEIAWTEFVAAIGKIDKRDPKFIPHPATWLTQGRYLDHRPVAPPTSNGIGWRPGLPTAEEILNGKAPREDGNQGSDPPHRRPQTAPVSQSGAGFHCLAPK